MAIPLKYNLRNLKVRWITTVMTILGLGLVTAIFVAFSALGVGMERTLVGTGHPLNMIVLRKNAMESQSEISREKAADVKALEGIARDADGEPLVSAEIVVVPNTKKMDGGKANIALRGVNQMALKLREGIKIIPGKGRWFEPNLGEIVVGKGAAARFADLQVGDTPFIGRPWKVVGIFEADGQAYESEIWAHIDDVKSQFKREQSFSSLIVRCPDVATVKRLGTVVSSDQKIQLEGKPHAEYYKEQNMSAMMLKAMGGIMGFVLAIGGIFGAANTMFAAVSSRTKEIATLRVLGFSRLSIWMSFTLEAALIGLVSGAFGAGLAWLIVSGLTTGTVNWQTFSEVAFQFQVSPGLMASGIVMATLMGVVGGFLPAFRASRATIAKALRGL